MFRSLYHEKNNSIYGIVLMTTALLFFAALIFLHNDVTGNSSEHHSPRKTSRLIVAKPISGFSETTARNTFDDFSDINEKKKRLPQVIIIGARKSGTRALLKFLEVNPKVRAANKEIHFFDKPQNYKLGLDWYREQLPKSDASDITIEKSPAYFVTPGVAERVYAMNSSIKLVLIFRDPVTRLISDYSQLVANKIDATVDDEDASGGDYGTLVMANDEYVKHNSHENLTNFAWIKAEKDFEEYVLRPDGGIDDQRRAIKIGMYSMYLEKWRSIFSVNQFHFVDGETLIKNPYEELHKLELFLNLEQAIKPESFVFNHKKGFYCIASNQTDSYESKNVLSTEINTEMTDRDFDTNILTLNCLSRSKGRRHVAVRKELIEELQKFYAPYNEYLFSLTGKNFSWS